jgi:serine/threonine-protein kinase
VSLPSGARLGPYEIVAPLGAGGMGEVYKGRDTRLDRIVAVKILPEMLAADPLFRERFQREARAISLLSHPHICTLHDIGEDHGTAFLVMEYLEGETLGSRLMRGALPVDEAIRLAIQIADALNIAHRAGIVHRDLKPGNVMLTGGGAKLLDFGLAKASGPGVTTGTPATMLPTTPAHLTAQGTIVGTLQYMAPEQLEGEEVDSRTDIFAFGAVLYEMVTGRRAFEGKSQASLVGAILKDTPPTISTLQPLAPAALDRVVMTCLEKRRDDRWQTMADLRRQLQWILDSSRANITVPDTPRVRTRRWRLAAIAAAVLAVAAASVAAAMRFVSRSEPHAIARLAASIPATTAYRQSDPGRGLAISPDGGVIVYAGNAGPGRRHLYRRTLDRLEVDEIPGTDGAYQPFFSPDGGWIGFFTVTGDLKKVALAGGPAVTLVRGLQSTTWAFGAWRADRTIVFSVFATLMQVSEDGGMPTPITSLGSGDRADLSHQFPSIVPSTGDVIFTVNDADARWRVDILRNGTNTRSTLLDNATAAVMTPWGDLLFTRDDVLMSAPFDPNRRTVGAPTPVSDPVVLDTFGVPQLAVSNTGTLAYVERNADAGVPTLGWVTRGGTFTDVGPLPAGSRDVALSPDGSRAVILGTNKVFLFDIARKVSTPLPIGNRRVESAQWHPDGKRITLGGAYLSLFDPDTGTDTRLTSTGRPKRFATWSPDGRSVAYMTFEPSNDIYILTLDGDRKPRPLISTSAAELVPSISPDGRWIAYSSRADPSGRLDVFVARFPEITGRVQVTSSGGNGAFWSPKGDELFFAAPPGVLQSVSVGRGDRLDLGAPRTLFPLGDVDALSPAPDGSRFLAIKVPRVDPPRQFAIVQNWRDELARASVSGRR